MNNNNNILNETERSAERLTSARVSGRREGVGGI